MKFLCWCKNSIKIKFVLVVKLGFNRRFVFENRYQFMNILKPSIDRNLGPSVNDGHHYFDVFKKRF